MTLEVSMSVDKNQGQDTSEHPLLRAQKGADPNAEDSYRYALTQAIRQGYESLAITLVEKGANPDVGDTYGFALTQAIRGGLESLAIKLIENGA